MVTGAPSRPPRSCPTVTSSSSAAFPAIFASTERYNPIRGTWSKIAGLPKGVNGHSATLLPNGKVLVAGGTHCPIDGPRSLQSSERNVVVHWQPQHRALGAHGDVTA